MILSDRDIKKLLKEGKIKVEPMENPDVQIQPSGIDLRLGNEFRVFKTSSTTIIDTKAATDGYTDIVRIKYDKPFIIYPGDFLLATTKKYIKMADDLMGV